MEERAYLGPGLEVAESLGPSHFSSFTCSMNTINIVVKQDCLDGFQIDQHCPQKALHSHQDGYDMFDDGHNGVKDGQF